MRLGTGRRRAGPGRGMCGLAALLAVAGAPARAQEPAAGAAPVDLSGPEGPSRGEQPCAEGRALGPGACFSGEVLADGFVNTRGGVHRGAAALAQAKLGLGLDLGAVPWLRGAGLEGWSFQVTAFGIYGRQPTPTLIGGLAPLSNAEALSTFRLSELWLERRFEDLGSVRFGQLAADSEFFTAAAAGGLTNGTFGWPLATSTALPSGGPAYPFAAPGVRLALGDPDEGSGLRAAIFSGDPGGKYGDGTDPQRHNRYGTNFSLAGGAFLIAEAVVGAAAPEGSEVRPWVGKLGGWYHNGGFADQRGDLATILGGPPSSGIPDDTLPENPPLRRRRNNYGGYAIGEVTLWRGESGSVATFARASVTPSSRNLLGFYADAGVAWRGPFGREGDTISVGAAYARTGSEGRDLDRALRASGAAQPVRSREFVLEANYDLAVVPEKLFVRPLVQWISNPSAGIPDERYRTDAALRDAVVLGVRVRATL